jgi:putative transposase
VEIDTIVRFVNGIKLYILNAVDINLKFQFSYGYTRLNSKNATDFIKRLELVYRIKNGVHTIQTDNGLEFMGEFDDYIRGKSIRHVFIYPRCPKINAYVEQANRTLVEEFIEGNEHLVLDNINDLNYALVDYLVWYNTERIHKSLGNISPINYLLKILPQESQRYVTYTLA